MFGHKKAVGEKPVKKVKKPRKHKHNFERSFILDRKTGKYYVANACVCGLFKELQWFEYDLNQNGTSLQFNGGATLEYLQSKYGNLKVYVTDNIFGKTCELISPLDEDEE